MSQVWILKQSSITWYVRNCCYGYNRYFFMLKAVFHPPSLYVITDNVDILHLVHMFAC